MRRFAPVGTGHPAGDLDLPASKPRRYPRGPDAVLMRSWKSIGTDFRVRTISPRVSFHVRIARYRYPCRAGDVPGIIAPVLPGEGIQERVDTPRAHAGADWSLQSSVRRAADEQDAACRSACGLTPMSMV